MPFHRPATHLLLVRLVTLALALVAGPGVAADDPWLRYENTSFVAYSRAPEKKVIPLLHELENFRAAFLQVGSIVVPADAPRTLVFIPASSKEFRKLKKSRLVAGFAENDGQRTLIVMPVYGDKGWTRTVVRHEYGHALLRYKHFDYPAWYEEGFAELVSSTELVNKGKAFTLGTPPRRAKENGPPIFDWNDLVSQEFHPETMTNPARASSAYAQAWLLAHWTTLGNNLKNASILQTYFDRLKSGESLSEAFEASFGMTADKLWDKELKAYTKRIPGYTIPYRPGTVDLNFSSGVAAGRDVDGIVRYLQLKSAVEEDPDPPSDVIANLEGRWAPLRIGLECEDYVEFKLAGDAGILLANRAALPGDQASEPTRFQYKLSGDGSVELEPPDDDVSGFQTLRLRQRTVDLLCMAADGDPESKCTRVSFRCGR